MQAKALLMGFSILAGSYAAATEDYLMLLIQPVLSPIAPNPACTKVNSFQAAVGPGIVVQLNTPVSGSGSAGATQISEGALKLSYGGNTKAFSYVFGIPEKERKIDPKNPMVNTANQLNKSRPAYPIILNSEEGCYYTAMIQHYYLTVPTSAAVAVPPAIPTGPTTTPVSSTGEPAKEPMPMTTATGNIGH